MAMTKAPQSIDAYLKTVEPSKRAALEKLRAQIHAAAPGAVEVISYQMPGFQWNGKHLVWFAAAKHGCSLFPGSIVESFAAELKNFDTSKGTIRFTPEKTLPAALVKKIVKAKMASILESQAAKKKR